MGAEFLQAFKTDPNSYSTR